MESIEYVATDIAIVGMSSRLPGSSNPDEFWVNLREGRESIVDLSDSDLLAAGVSENLLKDPHYVKRAPLLKGVEWFDAAFFALNPNEARVMDPQHRLFLECGWHALEDAGYAPDRFEGPIGVFGGSGYNAYMTYHLARNQDLLDSMGFFLLRHTGNDKDFLTTRLSYCLNLTGPSVNVQTACSTSLVAIHLASQSLINFECDIALAGGSTIELPLNHGYRYRLGEIYSPDGRCRAFDADSQGTVFGSGCGMVTLRRLEDALKDGDNIRAIIKGSAVNNDGAGKAGYLAPSVEGQAKVILEALEFSDVDPESVTYVETHGTGTAVGDPIEISALTMAYGAKTEKKQYCAIGSVKSNIGHLDTAAGVASIIKATLSLENKMIPASLHYHRPNPEIDFGSTPFFVNAKLSDWKKEGNHPRRAAVSSLGVGGTNAHIILEEAPGSSEPGPSREVQLILLSAKNENSLQAASDNLVDCLDSHDHFLGDVAYTCHIGRQHFEMRRAIVCKSRNDLITKLDADKDPMVLSGETSQGTPSIVFMYTGQGAQHVGMAKELYHSEHRFRASFDQCAQLLQDLKGPDIKALILNADPADISDIQRINQTENAQPALFVVEYCLAKLWMYWGIKPDAMIGHSIGEYVAACLSGVFSLEASLKLVVLRGRLMQSVQPGSMLAVPMPASEVQPYLSDRIELAAVNSTSLCVLSGKTEDILSVQKDLEAHDSPASLLKTSHAFHSRSMESILDEFEKAVKEASPQAPSSPFVSNRTGDWIKPGEAVDPGYWSQHLRRPVLFAAGISKLLEESGRVFLEVGPGSVLTQLVKRHEGIESSDTIIKTLGGPKSEHPDLENVLNALGRLWIAGASPDWIKFYEHERRRRVSLPGYAFNRQRYWVDRDGLDSVSQSSEGLNSLESSDSLEYTQVKWVPVDIEGGDLAPLGKILMLGYGNENIRELKTALQSQGSTVLTATFSGKYQEIDESTVLIRRSSLEDYEKLLSFAENVGIGFILHCGNLPKDIDVDEDVEEAVADAFVSPLLTLQAVASLSKMEIIFLSHGAYSVTGDETQTPIASLTAGPGMVAGLELPHLNVCSLDLYGQESVQIISGIRKIRQLTSHQPSVFALRSDKLYSKALEACELAVGTQTKTVSDGCYLVTGGLSGLGFEVSRNLVQTGHKKIAIIGKTPLPYVNTWEQWLERHPDDDPITVRIHRVKELKQAGAKVVYYAADLADEPALSDQFKQISDDFGAVTGVIHCAGDLNDGPLLTKEVKDALAVLAPKVQGTLNLTRLVKDQQIENFLLFSSVSSLWGSPGQIDYVSANAFLDAFVSKIKPEISGRVLSINWAAWRGTGMTERIANPEVETSAQLSHPLLDHCLSHSQGTSVYSTQMSADKHWIINEHRAAGTYEPILPGTGFLEIVKAAFEPLAVQTAVRFTDVMFLSPFVLGDDKPRELRVQFEPWALGTTFSVISQADPEDQESWFIHMKGRIGLGKIGNQYIDLDTIRARCSAKQSHPNEQLKFLSFGPRWQVIQSVQLGREEALLELKLEDRYMSDIQTIWSHPGMLDVATAGVLRLVEGYDPDRHFYVPIAYSRIEFFGAMPGHWISHIVYKPEASQPGDIVVFDVTVANENGQVLAVFEEFMLKCIEGPETLVSSRPPLSARANPVPTSFALSPNSVLQRRLEDSGIDSGAGVLAFNNILSSGIEGQIAITRGPIRELLTSMTSDVLQQEVSAGENKALLDVSKVEEYLTAHDAVIRSAVIAKKDRFGEIKVAAFVQLDPIIPTTVSELRRYVRKEVEDQLVPSKFVELDELPINSEGEVDKGQLPDPFSADDDFVAPSTDTEMMLTQVWQDILGVDQISITDNFFDLGGHSLLGVRLLAAIRKKTGIRLEDVVVVTYTLEQISAELDKRMGAAGVSTLD